MKAVLNFIKDVMLGSIELFISPVARLGANLLVDLIIATPSKADDRFAEELARNILTSLGKK